MPHSLPSVHADHGSFVEMPRYNCRLVRTTLFSRECTSTIVLFERIQNSQRRNSALEKKHHPRFRDYVSFPLLFGTKDEFSANPRFDLSFAEIPQHSF
jgi:hypothetical protein